MARLLVIACLVLTLTAAAAQAAAPIGPHEHFAGLVNGRDANAQVRIVCPGPVNVGRTAAVLSGQTLSVVRRRAGGGDTGLFSHVYAWFVPASGTTSRPTTVTFTKFNAPQNIPTSIQVPCGGQGQVEFSSCPYLAPCAAGWTPEFVTVEFDNIAV